MSGIYLRYDPGGLDQAQRDLHDQRIRTHTVQTPDKVVETFSGSTYQGTATHYGIMPTGGGAKIESGSLIATGYCWCGQEAEHLATPSELLGRFAAAPDAVMDELGGIFSIAHIDQTHNRLVVATDRWGSMPIYYRRRGRGLAVANEIKYLLDPGHDSLNDEAFAEMMAFGYIATEQTLFSGIKRIPPHTRLIFADGTLQLITTPNVGYPRNRRFDDDAIAEYDAMVRRFYRRFAGLTSQFSISMSGGLDSRLVAACAQREGMSLKGFTIGEAGALDADYAIRTGKLMGFPVHNHVIDGSTMPQWFGKMVWLTEGRALTNHMHYMTANFTQAVPKGPQLHGIAGETVLGGHVDVPTLFDASPAEIEKACRKTSEGITYWPDGRMELALGAGVVNASREARDKAISELFAHIGFTGRYSDYIEYKVLFRGSGFSLPCLMGQVIPWSDVISPFMDPQAHDFGASIRFKDLRERKGQLDWGLKYFPELAQLPRIKAGVVIPLTDDDPEAYNRGARQLERQQKLKFYLCRLSRGRINLPTTDSFPYYGQWYRRWRGVRDYISDILLSERTLDRGLFQREGVTALLNDSRIGRNTWGSITTLLMVELLMRQFIDGTDLPVDPISPHGFDTP